MKDLGLEMSMLLLATMLACGPLQKGSSEPVEEFVEPKYCYLYVHTHNDSNTRESCYEGPIECEDARHFAERRFDARVVSSCYREVTD